MVRFRGSDSPQEGYVLHLQQGMNLSNSCGQDGTLISGLGGGGVRLGVGGMGGFDQGEISEMFFSIYAF